MLNKIGYVGGVVVAVIVVTIFLTIAMPAIKTFTDLAVNDTTVGNYSGYKAAAAAAPVWIYAIPFVLGGAAIFSKLMQKGGD